jgi:hypothetical protein
MLENHSHVNLVRIKPVVLEYVDDKVELGSGGDGKGVDVCDACDACDDRSETPNKNNDGEIFSRVSGEGSHTSHTSHYSSDISNEGVSIYQHLIETEYLPHLDRPVYRCRECPDAPPYYDLRGMEESHFKPSHSVVGKRNGEFD